ncbi:MAG: branched-chain amino acid ABC transporter permease [Desulfobacterales bacterium]|nr:branched-chain amino acid ABC transporter permease [Desulfobacterales bacterium]
MSSKRLQLLGVVLLAAVAAVPLFVESRFVLHMVTLIFFYIALTSAWNIPVFGGKMSLGHAAFGAILYVKFGVSPWIGVAAGVAVSLLGGVVMTLPLLRLRGPFFTLASIAFAEVLRMVAIDWRSLTNGSVGLNIPFKPGWANLTFQSGKPFYFISLILAVAVVFVAYRLRHSALGYHLRASASNDEAAQALGVNTRRAHFIALLWSSGLTGLIGVFYVFFIYVVEPNTMFSTTLFSLQPALNGIIGGIGTIWGPIIGAVVMTPFGEYLRFYLGTIQQGLNYVVYGVVLIVTVNFIPGGIVSLMRPRRSNRSGGSGSSSDTKEAR